MASELSTCLVKDRDGQTIHLGDFWSDQPALLIFLRHFGCIGCSEHVCELSPHIETFDQLGIRVVFIGNGRPDFIKGFMERQGLYGKPVTIVSDPSLAVYKIAHMKRSLWGTMGPLGMRDALRAWGKGHWQNSIEGDVSQMGGSLLVDTNGEVAYNHISQSLSDHPHTSDLMDAAMHLIARKHEEMM
jgi:peroxiredoxin